MPLSIVTPTILAGQSLSGAVDMTTGQPEFIIAPANWTAANISFQVSTDGITFGDLHDAAGREVIMSCVAGSAIEFRADISAIKGGQYKIRSGSRDHPVVQEQDAQFSIAVWT
jgi:hypothetical protein